MMLSEKDARKKVCPLMSHQHSSMPTTQLCLASGCMKWRWVPDKSPEEVEVRKTWMGTAAPEPKGYCGA